MEIKPFVYVAVAGVTIGLLVISGGMLGQMTAEKVEPLVAPSASEVTVPTYQPTTEPPEVAQPKPAPDPIQEVGLQPPRLAVGSGPYGSVEGTGTDSFALTIDDGPNPDWTPQVLAVLRQFDIKATFCLIGEQATQFPDLVRAIVADGHTLCNHSWDHNEELGDLSEAQIRANIQQATDAIEAAAPGVPISYYRQPGGNWTSTIVSVARELGMSPLNWSVDPQDWTVPPVATIVSTVESTSAPGSIILMHDGGGNRANSVAALREFLPVLNQIANFIPLPTGAG